MLNKVLVIGAVNIDIFASTSKPYVLEDSNPASITLGFGGVGGNIATNLNNLNLDVSILTTFSSDLLGTFLKNHYHQLGIDTTHALPVDTKNTSVYLGVLNQDNDLFLGLNDMAITNCLNIDYIAKNTDYINQFEVIVLDNNLELETLEYIVTTFQDKTIIIDAVSAKKVGKLANLLPYISVLKVNQIELNVLSKETTLELQIKDLLSRGLTELLVTNKELPVCYATKELTKVYNTLPCDKIINATGAGDAFISGYIYGLLKNLPLDNKIALAMKFARDTLMVSTSTIEKGEFYVK